MEAKLDNVWLKDTDFNKDGTLSAVIAGLQVEQSSRGKPDRVLLLALPNKEIRAMSVWGGNWNFLVYHLGAVTEAWTGKTVLLKSEIVEWKDGQQKRIKTFYGAN